MQEAKALAEAQRAEAIALAKRRQVEQQQQQRQEALRAQLERDRLNRLETERAALAHMHHAKSLLFYGCSTAPAACLPGLAASRAVGALSLAASLTASLVQ
jgi:hypothetical protein